MSATMETFESRTLMSATPALSDAQKAALEKLHTDLVAVRAKSEITLSQVKAVVNDFTAIAKVAHKPDASTVTKYKTDLTAAWSDKVITTAEKALLGKDIQAIVASAGVPKALAQQTAKDIGIVVAASHVTKSDVKLIFSDIAVVIGTFKN